MNSLFVWMSAVGLTFAWASEPVDGNVKALMHTFLLEVSKIDESLKSDEAFTLQASKERVSKALANLERKTANPPSALQESPGFRISFNLLADHLKRTKDAFDAGEYSYARVRILGTPNLCASCHTQTPQPGKFSSLAFLRDRVSKTSFDNANFLYMFRRYDEALEQYDRLAREYPGSGVASGELEELFRRKLSIFARVKRDPVKAIQNLKLDLANKNLPVDVQKDVQIWIGEFEKWQREPVDPATLSTRGLLDFVEKQMSTYTPRNIAPSHPRTMTLLRLSGLVYERLFNEKDKDLVQELLYQVARCERSLSPLYWYSLSEIYLKECLTGNPHGKFSAKCYKAYEEGMRERYFGKPIPESVRLSLEALKKYL